MKALIYCRVSSMEQVNEGNSLVSQERVLRDLAAKRGYEPVVFIEKGESAKTIDRTKLKEMMEYAAKNKKDIGILLVYKVDRLSRETADYLTLKKCFNQLGINIESATEKLENSPIGRFTETLLAGSAQFDNEVRAERSKNGMIQAVMEGRYVWKAPIGYINTKVNNKSNIAPSFNQELVEKIRNLWEMIDSGMTPEQARQKVNKNGLVEILGHPLNKSQLYKILDNPLYKGVITTFGMEIISDSIVPIIEPNLYDRVYSKLHTRKKSESRYQKINPEFPLRGLLNCINHHHITGSASHGNGGRYAHYHCVYCKGGNNHFGVDEVHQKFKAILNNYQYDDTYKELLEVAIMENWKDRYSENKKRAGQIESIISGLESKKRQIFDKNIKGVINDYDAKNILDETNLEIGKLKLDLNNVTSFEENLEDVVSFGFNVLSNLGDVWNDIDDVEIKYRFQKFLFPSGITFDGTNFETSDLPLCLRIKDEVLTKNSSLVTPRGIEPRLPG